jgi:hypothetical protein
MLSHPPAPSTLSQHHHHHHQLLPTTVLGSPRVSLALLPLEECVCLCAFFHARLVWKVAERRRDCFFLLSKINLSQLLLQNFGSRQSMVVIKMNLFLEVLKYLVTVPTFCTYDS